ATVSTTDFPRIGVQLVRETKNLVRLTRFGMVNCFLVREDDGPTLVDTGVAGSAGGIRKAAQPPGAPIRRILLTHAHVDHVASLDALASQSPRVAFCLFGCQGRLAHRRRCFYHPDRSARRRNVQTSLSLSCFIFVELSGRGRERAKIAQSQAGASCRRPRPDRRVSSRGHGSSN